jgi:hypothetical protein
MPFSFLERCARWEGRRQRPSPNPKMSSHGCLTPDADEILKHCRTRNTDLGNNDATPPKYNIVADLHQVIETRTSTDHYVVSGACP